MNQPQQKVRLGMVDGGPGSNIGAIADVIVARRTSTDADPLAYLFPTVEDGVLGVKFVDAAMGSHQRDGAWVDATLDLG